MKEDIVRRRPRHPADPSRQLSVTAPRAEADAIMRELGSMRRRIRLGLESRDEVQAKVARVERRSLARLLADYAASRPNARTRAVIEHAARVLGPLAKLDTMELTAPALGRWYQDARQRYATSTLRTVWGYIRAAWGYGIALGWLPPGAPPWGSWRAPRADATRPWLTEVDHCRALLAAAAAHDRSMQARGRSGAALVAVALGVLAGLRQGEVCALAWDDLYEDEAGEQFLRIRHQAPRGWHKEKHEVGAGRPVARVKGGSRAQRQPVALLHVSPALRAVLEHERERQRQAGTYRLDGPVCPAPNGSYRRTPVAITSKALRAIASSAGIPNAELLVPHSLRHTFASIELRHSGGDLAATQRRTRHSSIAALEPYAHALGMAIPRAAQPLFELPALAAAPAPQALTVATAAPEPAPRPTRRGAVPWGTLLARWIDNERPASFVALERWRERVADRARKRAARENRSSQEAARRARARFDRHWKDLTQNNAPTNPKE